MAAVPVKADQIRGTTNEEQKEDGRGEEMNSRLRGVHGRGRVSDVLGALEHPEGQTGEEVSG